MIRSEVVITLPGHPAPKGSMKCVAPHARGTRQRLVEQLEKTIKPWRAKLHHAFGRVTSTADQQQPIGVEVTFTVDRPKSVRRPFPSAHGSGDVDKLARVVLDDLERAGILPNDAQVVELTTRKTYPDGPLPDALPYPGARIRLYPIGDQ